MGEQTELEPCQDDCVGITVVVLVVETEVDGRVVLVTPIGVKLDAPEMATDGERPGPDAFRIAEPSGPGVAVDLEQV